MKITPFWASVALSCAPAVLAQSPTTSTPSTTTASAASSCTASLIASLCTYPEPGPDFAAAIDSRASCWDYCNDNQPCDFVIFAAGNPTTGSGTCWLYPGQTFDASKGSSDCGNPSLSVYNKPVCSGGTATGACAATATPSAIASVCGYPPPGDCFSTCSASEGATDCLSQCANADSCSYVVFNPHNPDNSQYAAGTCWIYTNGTYDAGSAATCSGAPEQYVYNNVCPKPSPSPSPSPSSSSPSASSPSTTAPSNHAGAEGAETAGATPSPTTISKNSAPTGLSLANPLAMGVAMLIWQGL